MSDDAEHTPKPNLIQGYIVSKSSALSVRDVTRLRRALKELHPRVWEALRAAGKEDATRVQACGSGHDCGNFGPCAHRTDDDCINEQVTVCDVEACPSQACDGHVCEVNGCSGQNCSGFTTSVWTQQGASTRDIVRTDGWAVFVKDLGSGATRARLS
jgi:hypothetical protein